QSPQIVSLGLSEASFLQLMKLAGFRAVEAPEGSGPNWVFRGRQKARPPQRQRPARDGDDRGRGKRDAPQRRESTAAGAGPKPAAANAFAGLAELLGRNG